MQPLCDQCDVVFHNPPCSIDECTELEEECIELKEEYANAIAKIFCVNEEDCYVPSPQNHRYAIMTATDLTECEDGTIPQSPELLKKQLDSLKREYSKAVKLSRNF